MSTMSYSIFLGTTDSHNRSGRWQSKSKTWTARIPSKARPRNSCLKNCTVYDSQYYFVFDDSVFVSPYNFFFLARFSMKLIATKNSLEVCSKVDASSFCRWENVTPIADTSTLNNKSLIIFELCRRRLPVIMVRNHMAENLKSAVTFIEQGRIL